MKTHIAYRNFTMCKAVLLAALIGASAILAPLTDAKQHPVAQAGEELEFGWVPGMSDAIRINAVVARDGDVAGVTLMKTGDCPKDI